MNGFVTESVSKISDGFGSALKLLAFVGLTALAIIPIRLLLGLYGVAGLLILLFALSVFYFQRSFKHQLEEKQKAWCGMVAGVLLWQVTRYFPEVPNMGWLDRIGFLYWAGLALLITLLWKVIPTGTRFLLITFMLNWIGRLYLLYMDMLESWPRVISFVYPYIHYIGIVGILISVWWIVTRSQGPLERKYGGLALYFFVLLTFLMFSL